MCIHQIIFNNHLTYIYITTLIDKFFSQLSLVEKLLVTHVNKSP